MIRFVDMRPGELGGRRFGFWNTVTGRFIEIGGDQAWQSWGDYESAANIFLDIENGDDPSLAHPDQLERFRGLCPPWVLEPPADDECKFYETLHIPHDGDESVVYLAHEAKRVDRWIRAAEAAGLELGEWLKRCADREAQLDVPDVHRSLALVRNALELGRWPSALEELKFVEAALPAETPGREWYLPPAPKVLP